MRLDICFALQKMNQFMNSPKQTHLDIAFRIIRYVKSQPSLGVFFSASSSLRMSAFLDSDWVGCPKTKRPISGYCIKLGDSLISGKVKKKT